MKALRLAVSQKDCWRKISITLIGGLSVMASLEKSSNSLQTGVGVEPLFMLRCDRNPVMLT
jgi:hypothetical protein